jgi:Laminin G domain
MEPMASGYLPRSVRRGLFIPGSFAAMAAVAAVVAFGSAAAATVVATWPMRESGGTVMVDSVAPAQNGNIGPLVSLTVTDGYDFPGWRNNLTNGGKLQGTIPAGGSLVSVPDPNAVFDPNPGFAVSVGLRARLTSQGTLPTRATNGAAPSYNVVQKGRNNASGGFWKLEIAGSGNPIGKIRCVAGDGQSSKVAVSAARVDDGTWHTVGCELVGGRLTAIVDGIRRSVAASTLGAIHPGGKWGTSLSIGKKPGSTDPADAFSGWLRSLTFSTL